MLFTRVRGKMRDERVPGARAPRAAACHAFFLMPDAMLAFRPRYLRRLRHKREMSRCSVLPRGGDATFYAHSLSRVQEVRQASCFIFSRLFYIAILPRAY